MAWAKQNAVAKLYLHMAHYVAEQAIACVGGLEYDEDLETRGLWGLDVIVAAGCGPVIPAQVAAARPDENMIDAAGKQIEVGRTNVGGLIWSGVYGVQSQRIHDYN